MDELQRRRHARATGAEDFGDDGEEVHFGWTDILAFTIAAFQIILPILFLFFAVIGVVYLIFKFLFT